MQSEHRLPQSMFTTGTHQPEGVMSPREMESGTLRDSRHINQRGQYTADEGLIHRRRQVNKPQVVASSRQDHKDSLNRYVHVKDGEGDYDRYLNPEDWKLVLLRVQRAPNYQRESGLTTTWADPIEPHPIVRVLQALVEASSRILTWTYNDRLRAKSVLDSTLPRQQSRTTLPANIYWKYPTACLLLTLTALFGGLEGPMYPGGRYLPVRYKYFSYSKIPRNREEAPRSHEKGSTNDEVPLPEHRNSTQAPGVDIAPESGLPNNDEENDGVMVLRRHLRPRKLCVIRGNDDMSQSTPASVEVVDSLEWDPTNEMGEYVFVSYTRAQFHTYSRDDMGNWDMPATEEAFKVRAFMYAQADVDRQRLLEVGIQAARDAGVKAFWIDIYCMNDAETVTMDSHRICDVARGAKTMVIALQDTVRNRALGETPLTADELLQSWSARLWTLPEILLAPTRHDLKIYLVRDGVHAYDTIPKRSMAARAYRNRDATLVRQLVDHFEASQQLTMTELLTIGLECLVNRETNPFMPADQVYALMTMVRRRPIPSKNDTLFEAFAKLSLLNDSNSLLERLICILPRRRGEPWHRLEDFWGAKLWEIEPTVQVAAIASDQTVILDGGFGAAIDWRALNKVGFLKRNTIWRVIGQGLIRGALILLLLGIVLLLAFARHPLLGLAIVIFLIGFSLTVMLPYTLMRSYSGKFLSTQALLLGLEGQADIEWLETKLFGYCQGRLRWSTWSSTQSLHRLKSARDGAKWIDGEVEAVEPIITPLENANPEATEPDRVFTIIDTYTMTASLIRTVHPPTVALVCGQEGGMRRVLLCSYDYRTQTFHRETVIRMPTKILDRMDRVEKFRFSMASLPLYRGKN